MIDYHAVDTQALLDIVKCAENRPDELFDMDQFISEETLGVCDCKTAGCLVGTWAITHPYYAQIHKWWNDDGSSPMHMEPGTPVVVSHGPFVGLEGIFERHVSSRQRCRVLLQVVGGLSPVELEETDIALALPKI